MTRTMAELRAGLAGRLATIQGLHASAYMLPRPEPPAACVLPSSAEFDRTFDSDDTDYYLSAWIYCSPADLVKAQQDIDEYMAPSGSKSFRAAIDGDNTLGLLGVCCYVLGWRNYATLLDVAGSKMLGAELQCRLEA